jgi:hypothetical protein
MGKLFGGGAPKVDRSAADAAAAAAAAAQAEQERLKQQRLDEEDAIRRGLRGRRALLSSAGELGFSSTLGS